MSLQEDNVPESFTDKNIETLCRMMEFLGQTRIEFAGYGFDTEWRKAIKSFIIGAGESVKTIEIWHKDNTIKIYANVVKYNDEGFLYKPALIPFNNEVFGLTRDMISREVRYKMRKQIEQEKENMLHAEIDMRMAAHGFIKAHPLFEEDKDE